MFKYFLIIFCILTYSCSSKQDQYYENYKTPYQNQYAPPRQYQQYIPNSRAYSNPYYFPQQYPSPLYDSDQYYVPPIDYYNIENNQNSIQNSPANNRY